MRAVVCKACGPPENLVVEEMERLTPGRGQVVTSVKASGVNFPDTLIIQGLYHVKPPLPFSPCSEVAGIVKEVGAGVEHVKPGDHVISIATYGGFAEEVVAEAATVIPMPDAMNFDVAASFAMTYGTDLHALKDRAHLQPGETLLVLGVAGVVSSQRRRAAGTARADTAGTTAATDWRSIRARRRRRSWCQDRCYLATCRYPVD
jgi:NADPH:quinone reductase